MIDTLVQDGLERNAARFPNKTALVCESTRLTYGQIDAMANRCAHALRDLGVQPGDRVALCLPNSVDAVVAIFGILKAGAVFVPIHPSTKRDKLGYIVNNCRASVLFTPPRPDLKEWANPASGGIPSLKAMVLCGKGASTAEQWGDRVRDFNTLQQDFPADPPPRKSIDSDLACLIYTTGSTGEPKGVMSDHGNVRFAASSIML